MLMRLNISETLRFPQKHRLHDFKNIKGTFSLSKSSEVIRVHIFKCYSTDYGFILTFIISHNATLQEFIAGEN